MNNKICIVVFLFLGISSVFAASPDSLSELITVEGAYVRGLPPSVKNTSAYMTIINNSDEVLMLTGAKTDIANSAMIHKSENNNGMMSMAHVMSLSIPAHGQVVLESGAIHLMIMGLKAPVASGTTVEITLLFQGDLEYTVSMPVRSVLDE